MHEMSIALSVVDIAVERTKQENGRRINEIVLEIGSLSGVLIDSLQFCFESAVKNTMAESAQIKIIRCRAKAHCSDCGASFETDEFVPLCPQCGQPVFDVRDGREMKIKYINID